MTCVRKCRATDLHIPGAVSILQDRSIEPKAGLFSCESQLQPPTPFRCTVNPLGLEAFGDLVTNDRWTDCQLKSIGLRCHGFRLQAAAVSADTPTAALAGMVFDSPGTTKVAYFHMPRALAYSGSSATKRLPL